MAICFLGPRIDLPISLLVALVLVITCAAFFIKVVGNALKIFQLLRLPGCYHNSRGSVSIQSINVLGGVTVYCFVELNVRECVWMLYASNIPCRKMSRNT